MQSDPTLRFSSRVEDYVRYRPSYPPDVIALLEQICGLTPDSAVADIGSGTGFLSELFLRLGCEVFGVEPNLEMRAAGERILGSFRRFHSVDGRAEATGLDDASVHLVTAGQAFHWFHADHARAEFRRILKPAGWVVLVWNERLVGADPFLAGYESLLHQYAPEYSQVDHRRIDNEAIRHFFEHDEWRTVTFDNQQVFDWDGVRGRLHSSSYAPQPGTESYAGMVGELETLFSNCQQEGCIRFLYETKVYYGQMPS